MSNRLTRIYTRQGDKGQTSLADGSRVSKTHPRIEAIGSVDELNSQLGLLIAELLAAVTEKPALQEALDVLQPIQHRLFDLGGELAMPEWRALQQAHIDAMEAQIDLWNNELGPLENFILPGGSRLLAQAHICRTLARRAERRCQQLGDVEPVAGLAQPYLNRLSDLLFVGARIIGSTRIPRAISTTRRCPRIRARKRISARCAGPSSAR